MSNPLTEIESRTIDFLRPLLAIMVVGLHVRPYYYDGTELFADGLYDASVIVIFRVLFSLAVPAFFLISGYLFFRNLENWDITIWKGKIHKRAKTLLGPYLLWNLIAFLGFIITRKAGQIIKGNSPVDLISLLNERGWIRIFWDRCLYGVIHPDKTNLLGLTVSAGTPMNEPTWFLRDLIVVILFTPLIHFLIRKTGRLFILITGILFCIDLWIPFPGFSSKSFFLFSVGAWFSINGRNMLDCFRRFRTTGYVISLLLLFAASVSFNSNEWVYCISFRLFIICGVPALFCLVSGFLSGKESRSEYPKPEFVDSSFFIYLIHTVLITDAVHWLLSYIPVSDKSILMFAMLIINTILVYLLCHCIYLLLKLYLPGVLSVLTGDRTISKKQ